MAKLFYLQRGFYIIIHQNISFEQVSIIVGIYMAETKTYKEKLLELRKKRFRSFLMNVIVVTFFSTIFAVLAIWLDMKNVFMFCFIGLVPGILSLLWDKKPGRFASKTVMALNITGIFPFCQAMLYSGSPNNTALYLSYEFDSWLQIYGFALLGWGLVYLVPKITLVFLEIKSKYMLNKMQEFQKVLLEEWGDGVKKL